VVRRDELPGAELSPGARERATVRARHEELLGALEKRRAELDRAALARSAAAEALADARGEGTEEQLQARRQQRLEAPRRQLESDAGTDLIVSTDAQALADEWAELLVELAATEVSEHDTHQVQAAHKRLEAARARLFEAESAARLPDLDREQVDLLENAHE